MFNNLMMDLRSHYRITADKREIKEILANLPVCFYLQEAIRHCKNINKGYLYTRIYSKVRR